jgi:hypothetical protein
MTDYDQTNPDANAARLPTSEELMAKHPEALSPDHAHAMERAEKGLSDEEIAEHQRLAELNAHPHTRLANLQKQMAAPGVLDVNARIGMLHSVISQLVQIIKEHTPGAPRHPDDPEEVSDGEG